MKKFYLFVIASFSLTSSHAQLTQSNHAPAPGDSYQMYEVSSANIAPGSAGSNATWDFSARATNSNVVNSYTTSAASSGSYPSANVVQGFSSSNMTYYNSTANELWYYGGPLEIQSLKATTNYSAPAIYGKYPMSLNTTSTVVTGGSISATAPIPASGTFTGTSMVELDGTGNLVLSTGTFSNVMRVHTTQMLDFVAGGGFITGTLSTSMYEYYGQLKSPLFTIAYLTATVQGNQYGDTLVFRNSNAVPVGIVEVEEGPLTLYPQPAYSQLQIKNLPVHARSVEVYDLSGRQIATYPARSRNVEVNVEDYPGGVFTYNIKSGTGELLQTGRFTVAR